MLNIQHINIASGVSKDISEKVNGMFPTWPSIVATIVAVLVLLLVLTKLVYKPVKESVDNRRNYIQNNISEAEKLNSEASLDRKKANDSLIEARVEAAQIIKDAKVQSDKIKEEQMVKAKLEASNYIRLMKQDIAVEKARFEIQSKTEMVEIALKAASRIIGREVNAKDNNALIVDYIDSKTKK